MRYLIALVILLTNFACSQHNNISKSITDKTACIFSQITYCTNTQELTDKYLPGWKIVWDAKALNGNHALVANNGQQYVIAIRGSLMEFSWDAFENWIYQDLNIVSQEKWNYCDADSKAKISTGAWRGFQNISQIKDKTSGEDLLDYLLKHTKQNDQIYITGHSLGGNLATVYATYLAHQFKEKGRTTEHINVITFAAPAAGNVGFADYFNKTFPKSIRVENTGDIVPKFPCTTSVSGLGTLYKSAPSASDISVGYKSVTVSLSSVFKSMGLLMSAIELQNGLSRFKQTNNDPTLITIKPSGRNTTNDIQSWFAEAGYQHGIAQYASALGAPVIECK